MVIFATLVTSYNWLGRWPYSILIAFPFVADIAINLLHIIVDWISNCHSGIHHNYRFIFRNILAINGFPLLWVNNFSVFSQIFLNKLTIGNDIISFRDVFVTHKSFHKKIHNLLVLLSHPEMEFRFRSILNMQMIYPRCSGLKSPALSWRSTSTNITLQKYAILPPVWSLSFRIFMWFIVSTKESY